MQAEGKRGGGKACDAEATGKLMMLLGLGAKPADDTVDRGAAGASPGGEYKADSKQAGNGGDEEVRAEIPCSEADRGRYLP